MPCRLDLAKLQQDFTDLIVQGQSTIFAQIDQEVARQAAELRANHNITLADALQIGVALQMGCEAFLTNDGY
jgi:predicted nucleic acid-binding protein